MKLEKELLKGVASMAVLEVLSHEPLYGYELGKRLTESTGNVLTLGQGSLYPLLYNLEAKGYIKAQDRKAPNGRRRRYYELTEAGGNRLSRQKKEWRALSQGIDRLFNGNGAPDASHASSALGRFLPQGAL